MLRALGVIVALAMVAFGSTLVLVNSLDRPWIKRRIQALVLSSGRVELDYGAVHVGILSGLEVRDLVVRSPAEVRGFASELVRVGRAYVRWSPSSLTGDGPYVRELVVEHVKLTVVVDEKGRTSFDAIASNPNPTPDTPLSALPDTLVGVGSLLGRILVSDVVVAVVRTAHKRVIERDTLQGLALIADAEARGVGRVNVALGQRDMPLTLRLERRVHGAGDGVATVRAFLSGQIRRSDAKLTLDIRVVQQNFVRDLTVDRLARVDAEAKFDPSAGRTEIALTALEAGDGAATVKASLLLPDRGPAAVRQASGDADLGRLLRLLPPGLVPVRIGRGQLRCRIRDLAFDRPSERTTVSIDGDVTDAEVVLADGSVAFGAARLSLSARPEGAGLATKGMVSVDALRAAIGAMRLHGDGISVELDAQRQNSGMIIGQVVLRFAALEMSGQGAVSVQKGRIKVQARDLVVDRAAPLATRGDVSIEGDAASLKGHAAIAALASALGFHAHTRLSGNGPLALDAELAAGRLRVWRPGDKALADAPVRVTLGLADISPNLDHPEKSQGTARVALQIGALRASMHATKRKDTLQYDMTANAPQLGAVVPLLPADAAPRVAWDKMALSLQSKGRVERLTSRAPKLTQHTQLRVTGVHMDALAARVLAFECESSGTATRHEIRADVRVEGLTMGDAALGEDRLTLSASLDLAQPSLHVKLGNDGVLKTELTANATFDRVRRVVSYDLVGHLSNLVPLAPVLTKVSAFFAGVPLSKTEFHVVSRGHIVGVISDVDARGTVRMSPDPRHTAGGQGEIEATATHLRWSEGDRSVNLPAAAWRASFHAEGEQRSIESDLKTDGFDLAFGRRYLKVSGFHDHVSATLNGSLDTGTIELSQQESIVAIKQNYARMYPIGDVTLNMRARRNTAGLIRISDLRIENRAAGTSLAVNGGIDVLGEQRRIAVRTVLKQDLARASTRKAQFVGRGKVSLDLNMQSPDLRTFYTKALLRLEDAQILLPKFHIAVDAIDGELPILADVKFGRKGVELLRNIQVNPYTMLRFADQHPLLKRQSFLSIGSVTTPMGSISPFAANIEIEQNILSLSQLEMGVRDGRITGSGLFEWKGAKSKLHTDIRVTGVKSSYGEPFDGNAALAIDFSDNSIEGRADILRIGRRHLLDLIDFQDPRRINPGMNQIRTALALGYPKLVNIAFKHGFASAGVTFGGLARLVSVGDVRGIPTGPLMERVLQVFKFEEQP